jgi:hypothetical protein
VACVILSRCEVNVTRAIRLCNDVSVFIIRKAQTYANYITSKNNRSKYSNDVHITKRLYALITSHQMPKLRALDSIIVKLTSVL